MSVPDHIIDELEALREAARNLYLTNEYYQEYINYLLGGMTDEQFARIAEAAAVTPSTLTDAELRAKALTLELSIGYEISKIDAMAIFNAEPPGEPQGRSHREIRPEVRNDG